MRFPPPLAPGARVALVAPSGPLHGADELERAIETTRRMGWDPVVAEHALDRAGYLAGDDANRRADLDRAAADSSIDGVWCLRGGYGAMRLLDGLDYDAWERHPKTLIGYSDITALHAAIGRRAGLVTFHGPTARAEWNDTNAAALTRAVADTAALVLDAPQATALCAGGARGRLAGGNLALLTALMGTPFAPDLDGAILVLEDVNESVYRIDRMLTQLRLAGALGSLAGLVFGAFTAVPPEATDVDRSLAMVLAETADRCDIPCLAGAPVGHIDAQWTLPLGAIAELDVNSKTLIVER